MLPYFVAKAIDGSEIREDQGLGKGVSFALVQEWERNGILAEFTVYFPDGFRQSVNLLTGDLTLGAEVVKVEPQDTPLRIIYYKRMYADTGGGMGDHSAHSPTGAQLDFVALGWQTTVPTPAGPRNVRFGSKVWPARKHFQVGEEI
jgi:hypothetical protein